MNLFDVYPLFDINIVKGKGRHVWDENGTEYLDLYGGHAVISIGHAHPHYVEKVSKQVATLGFYSNSVINKLQQEVAYRLGRISGYEDYSLFLINSGAEANENALKLASFYNGRTRIVSFARAFHGRTSLAVEATENPKIIAPINANGHVTYLPLNDINAIETELGKGDVCAVIIEGIQGVGGIQIPTPTFMQELRRICTDTNTVLILDEIQSGYGRSGKFFAHQYSGIRPDLITVAKGIGNGFPMAGVLISPMFTPVYGQLGTTFGGNHLACSAALAVLDVIEQEHLVENAAKVGTYLMEELKKLPQIKEVRGKGLMIGMEFDQPVKEIRSKLIYEQKVFTGASGSNVIRLLPPLCLNMEEAQEFLCRLKAVL
ncbi:MULTISPECIES: aspartate aminotransferase family protein [unclassified Bacteroides]|jgi:acetylornithine/N-succinyldiaminopimelate aminotransferase|uniref:aspartate aminotransferase family protein n=1 Tax=unclassified Bacteroides TaxID=2646097 RepID=UPI000E88B42F|nr:MULTISPECIES: aminotransferase class III-fold pyridoxal phosphate-dependent enzyme [unclassified Bacteroides]RGN46625.1 aminotransferase class III-fold pyridoxal phosphate-dependent enzyme [Bacteroides sp. OM05-12]RHR74619.1 aminotransferase class III-fold pyridoxal phosphate-dependent enzyme [Bacteroides sp. AF16-49]